MLSFRKRKSPVPAVPQRPTLRERVEAGAALLDEKIGPDWDKRIDTASLHIASSYRCVLGQLYRNGSAQDRIGAAQEGAITTADTPYTRGVEDLIGINAWGQHPAHYGFSSWQTSDWDHIDDEWVRLINERRLARSA